MFEKVNPKHPDKIADRIAGAIVDLAYSKEQNPRVAVEVLIGHGKCHIINETSVHLTQEEVEKITTRITGGIETDYKEVKQDEHLSKNQETLHCGDNGIFKGTPVTEEQKQLTEFVKKVYGRYQYDGKFIINSKTKKVTCCQSNCDTGLFFNEDGYETITNPIGYWTGGTDVDSGATNRKLGSDMGDSVTGGGLHGKDLSKADVSVNIYAWLLAQRTNQVVEFNCNIGDEFIEGIPYQSIVETAKRYIESIGGFEKFAEWGLIR